MLEFGVLATADGEVFEFEFVYGRGDIKTQMSTGTIHNWERHTGDWRDRPYHKSVGAALEIVRAQLAAQPPARPREADLVRRDDVMTLLCSACPSFASSWNPDDNLDGGERLLYLDVAEFVAHVLDMIAGHLAFAYFLGSHPRYRRSLVIAQG